MIFKHKDSFLWLFHFVVWSGVFEE